jgi:hypothetical protein
VWGSFAAALADAVLNPGSTFMEACFRQTHTLPFADPGRSDPGMAEVHPLQAACLQSILKGHQ